MYPFGDEDKLGRAEKQYSLNKVSKTNLSQHVKVAIICWVAVALQIKSWVEDWVSRLIGNNIWENEGACSELS